jgi:hypothetical protein
MLWSTWIMQLMIWILHSCPCNINHHPFGWISSTWLVAFVWSTWYDHMICCISVIHAVIIFYVSHVMYVVNFIHISKFHPFEHYYQPCCRFNCVMKINDMVQFHPYGQFIHVIKFYQIHGTMLMDEIDHTWNIAHIWVKLTNWRNVILNATRFIIDFYHVDQCKIKFDMDENDPQYQ